MKNLPYLSLALTLLTASSAFAGNAVFTCMDHPYSADGDADPDHVTVTLTNSPQGVLVGMTRQRLQPNPPPPTDAGHGIATKIPMDFSKRMHGFLVQGNFVGELDAIQNQDNAEDRAAGKRTQPDLLPRNAIMSPSMLAGQAKGWFSIDAGEYYSCDRTN